MNKTSVYLRVRDRPRNDGNSSVYFSITVNGLVDKLNLEIYWPEKLVDKAANNLKPRNKADKVCNNNNLMIGKEIGKFNEILVIHRLSSNILSIDQCIKGKL